MSRADGKQVRKGSRRLGIAALVCLLGIGLNFLGREIASSLGLVLYLDAIGTIAAAMLGGPIAGLIVGYFTNIVNTLIDNITIYYSVVSVIVAVGTAALTDRGWFKSVPKTLLAILLLGLVGGGISSVITWFLFGFGFADGVSTPLAQTIFDSTGLGAFWAQLVADVLVDCLDKGVSVAIALLVVHVLPSGVRQRIDFGMWHQRPLSHDELQATRNVRPRIMSLRAKVVACISIIMLIVGVVTVAISFTTFTRSMIEEQSAKGFGITNLVARSIDDDKVDEFLARGRDVEGYAESEQALANIRDSFPEVPYVYVYRIRGDGCQVVFDPDTADEPGYAPGEVVPLDEAFSSQLDKLLAGEPVDPVIANETHGWLLSVYQPLYNSDGICVAYAAVDISMDTIVAESYAFLARNISLCVSFFFLICSVALWISEYGIILPLNSIAYASNTFAFDGEATLDDSVEYVQGLDIRTGDEIEHLYEAVSKTVGDSVDYFADSAEKAATIDRMQSNLIIVMADLVESRDKYTGEHVRKTAAYVRVTMEQMRREGIYADQLTDEYLYDVERSAPLHDIGKIMVSDMILNKPGRLTNEEFRIMQNHTTAGAQIIESAVDAMSDPAYLDESRRLAVAHHEKWDGTGYPNGLSGEEIPLSARIMAVADVFDALVSRRSYKEGLPIDKALDIIRDGIGSHFDPLVAQAFLDAEDEVRRIAESHGDDKGTQTFDVHDE